MPIIIIVHISTTLPLPPLNHMLEVNCEKIKIGTLPQHNNISFLIFYNTRFFFEQFIIQDLITSQQISSIPKKTTCPSPFIRLFFIFKIWLQLIISFYEELSCNNLSRSELLQTNRSKQYLEYPSGYFSKNPTNSKKLSPRHWFASD